MKRIIVLFLLFSATLIAQESSSLFGQNPIFDRENPKYESSLERMYKNRSVLETISPQVLEGVLDDEEYFVGPGDQFQIHLFGELENDFICMVLPEGEVLIPTVGAVSISGLSLKAAKEKLGQKIKTTYIKSDIRISLVGLRKFRIYLSGEVLKPGTYFAQASDRVSDILEVAEGLADWADESQLQIRHLNGTIDTVNISDFFRKAQKEANPYVQGGDVIFVPPIDLTKPYVLVESHIEKILESRQVEQKVVNKKSSRKIYRLLENETLPNFLSRIASYSAEIDLSSISLIRNGKEQVMDLLNNFQEYDDFLLKSRDLLMIPDLVHEVYVRGEVRIPGAYIFNVNLTVNDYVGKAGVLERAKGSDYIQVIRKSDGTVLKGGDVIIEQGDTIIVPRKSRELIRDYIGIVIPVASILLSTYSIYTR